MTETTHPRRALFALVLGAACLVAAGGLPAQARGNGGGGGAGGAAGDGGPAASPNYDLIAGPAVPGARRPRPDRGQASRMRSARERWMAHCQIERGQTGCRPL